MHTIDTSESESEALAALAALAAIASFETKRGADAYFLMASAAVKAEPCNRNS